MLVSIIVFILYITIKFVTCGQFYETDDRQEASTKYRILSKEEQPSQLSCLHVCRVKHRYISTAVLFENGQCNCLQENEGNGENIINGQHLIARETPKVLYYSKEWSVSIRYHSVSHTAMLRLKTVFINFLNPNRINIFLQYHLDLQ